MAQIGTPPAGWYTDPSGQHRARFWDGAGWTEQVRDDIADQAAAPADVTAVANSPAETVAGVAEAVAAVATSDVIQPAGGEPPLIVDYGTDYQPRVSGSRSNGTAAPPIDPFADPAPLGQAGAGTMGSGAGIAAVDHLPPLFDPAAQTGHVDPAAQAAPTAAVAAPAGVQDGPPSAAPAPTGPAPGWYPDPAARHQARLWNGTEWTERVADNGIEALDPLPGSPAGATTTVTHDPTAGTWSEQLLDPDGPAAGLAGTGGVSAGQASLASLPDADGPSSDSTRVLARPTVKVRVGGGMVLGGAVALLLGSGMAWMQVRGPKVGDASSATGVNLGDGRITIVLAIVLAVLGAAIITGRLAGMGGVKVAAMGALVAGAAAVAVTAVDIADVADRAARLGVPPGAVTDVGNGLWLCFVGGLFAVGGGLLTFANRK